MRELACRPYDHLAVNAIVRPTKTRCEKIRFAILAVECDAFGTADNGSTTTFMKA